MPEANISVQGTPNPNAAKFTVDRRLVEGGGSKAYMEAEAAAEDRLASALFQIEGVESLLIAEDFVTVTKSESVSWDELIPRIERTLRENLDT